MLLRFFSYRKAEESKHEEFYLLESDGRLSITFDNDEVQNRRFVEIMTTLEMSIIDQVSLTQDYAKVDVFFNTENLERLLSQRRKIPQVYYHIFDMIYSVDNEEERTLGNLGLFYSLIKTSEYSEDVSDDPLFNLDPKLANSLEGYLEESIRKISPKVFQKRNILWGLLKIGGKIDIQESFTKYVSFGNFFSINTKSFSYFRRGVSPLLESKQMVPGGLIADEVGLGKTMTSLGIAMADKHFSISENLQYKRLCVSEEGIYDFYETFSNSEKLNTEAVLIIVPESKVKEWEHEIRRKVSKKIKVLTIGDEEDFDKKALKKYKSADYVIIGSKYIGSRKMFDSVLMGLQFAETEEDILANEKKSGSFWKSTAHLVREELSYADNPDNIRSIPVTCINWRMVIIDETEMTKEVKFLQHIFTKSLFVLSATPENSVYSLFFKDSTKCDKNGITRCNKRESLLDCDSVGIKITDIDLEYEIPEWYVNFMERYLRTLSWTNVCSQNVLDLLLRRERSENQEKILESFENSIFSHRFYQQFQMDNIVLDGHLPGIAFSREVLEDDQYPRKFKFIKDIVGEFMMRLKEMRKSKKETLLAGISRRIAEYLYEPCKVFLKKLKSDLPVYIFVTDFLEKFLEESEDEKIIVLTKKTEIAYFTQTLPKNLVSCILRGTQQAKENRLQKFKEDPNSRVLILFSEDCSGLNLDMANNILITYDAKEKEYRQVVGRSNRMNQERSINVYKVFETRYTTDLGRDDITHQRNNVHFSNTENWRRFIE